ncbi:MAG: hypothetical protein RLZZ71_812 [Bacteroidota bacterium]
MQARFCERYVVRCKQDFSKDAYGKQFFSEASFVESYEVSCNTSCETSYNESYEVSCNTSCDTSFNESYEVSCETSFS